MRLAFVLGLATVSASTSAPSALRAEDAKAAESPKAPDSCELLSRGPGVALQDSEVTLHTVLESFLSDIQKNNFDKLITYFHPRSKAKSDIGPKIKSTSCAKAF
ncbi:MAG: hypothetical protein EOP04_24525 [Proteobacteria bacterium]|nr:MAG: hypothetical protein EOP04_24525 [Pseudomonadota bacterium]